MNVLKLIASNSYIVVNKSLIKTLGTDTAILLGHLSSCQNYHGEWFFQTYEKIENETGIKRHTARTAIKKLEECGVLFSKREGIPCRTFYSIDTFKLQEMLSSDDKSGENDMTRNAENEQQDLPKSDDINKNRETTIKNENKHTKRDADFIKFYSAYPKHVAKGQAIKSWNKLWKDGELPDINSLISFIEKWKNTEKFKATEPKFIKNPSTWLTALSWEDDLPEESISEDKSNFYRGELIIEGEE